MPTEEYQWIIMDSFDTRQALKKYKSCEGKTFFRGKEKFECKRVIAGPRDLMVFSKKFDRYVLNSDKEVFSGIDGEYTLYFFNSTTKKPKFFLRLDDFVKDCLDGKPL